VLRQVETVIVEVQSAFMVGIALVQAPAALLSSFTGWVTGLFGSLTALPLASEYRISSLLPEIVAMPSDPAATAGAVGVVTGAYAQAIVDGMVPLASDPSGGLAGLANEGAYILAANSGSTPTLALRAANAVATVDLVRSAAVAAVAQVHAGTNWTSANAASAARDQLASLINARTLAAAQRVRTRFMRRGRRWHRSRCRTWRCGRNSFRSLSSMPARRRRQPWRWPIGCIRTPRAQHSVCNSTMLRIRCSCRYPGRCWQHELKPSPALESFNPSRIRSELEQLAGPEFDCPAHRSVSIVGKIIHAKTDRHVEIEYFFQGIVSQWMRRTRIEK
jgi:hypothetical protein